VFIAIYVDRYLGGFLISLRLILSQCALDELVLDKEMDKQWKQLGQDAHGLRLQLKFVRRAHGLKMGFTLGDIRATVPPPGSSAEPASSS